MAYYTWNCKKCDMDIEVQRPMSEFKREPTEEEISTDCSEGDGHEWQRIIKEVNFRSTERYIGKMEFAKDRARQELIEANRIEREMMNLPQDKREDHKKAIKKLKSTTGE